MMVAYIDAHRDQFGVEPICEVLQVAPSTYCAFKKRQPSARALRDAVLLPLIPTIWPRTTGSTEFARCGRLWNVPARTSVVTRSRVWCVRLGSRCAARQEGMHDEPRRAGAPPSRPGRAAVHR